MYDALTNGGCRRAVAGILLDHLSTESGNAAICVFDTRSRVCYSGVTIEYATQKR